MRAMTPEPLRGPTLEKNPKPILVAKTFNDFTRLSGTKPSEDDLVEIRSRIAKGLELLPSHYRRDHFTTPDAVLERFGYKHLHLGGQHSDVLLFLVEFEYCVVLAEINRHMRFRGDPPGANLAATHRASVAAEARAGAAVAGTEAATRQKTSLREAQLKKARETARARKP